ncbi:hypothetical protein MRB53_023558 [Persea americana]|uniref:Uncharacterized protein n=1 Tax=Persea americana TaxID=3435 RepID=A0ACC2LA40_PERAE|nr:hypothetical protein MRB53_023558 [Persea americana]
MKESGVINEQNIAESKVALVHGQMHEPSGARMRVGLTALTMVEYFQDVNEQDVLLFIDNIFRFVQAGSEVSALLVYVLADKLTDPAPATTFAHLDATTVLSRGLAAKGYELRSGEQIEEMTLNLCVLTPNRIIWDSEVKEIILSTNSGQIGVLPNHAPIATAIDIGILRIRLNDQWLTMAVMGGFARIGNNEITILVNDAEKGSDIDPQEAQRTLEIAEANLSRAEGKRQAIEANLALRRARTRVEAINVISC